MLVNINLQQVQQHAQIATPVTLLLEQAALHPLNALYALPVGILQEALLQIVLAVQFVQLAHIQLMQLNNHVHCVLQESMELKRDRLVRLMLVQALA